MTRYSVQHKNGIFVTGCGTFAQNLGITIC